MSSFRSLLSFAFIASLLSCGPVEHETISGMSQIVTPPAVPNFPPSLNIPTNGDGLDAAVFKLGVEDPLQAGVEAARLAVLGGGIRRRVVCTANNSLVIKPVGVVVATVGGTTWAVPHSTSTTIDPSALVTLAASTRYWVYAQLSAANPPVLSFIVSTDAPTTPGLFYRTGDTSALYISTFVTDGSGNILTYTQNDNEYQYSDLTATGGGTTGNLLLDGGTASTKTTVPASPLVPTGASRMLLAYQWSGGTATLGHIYAKGATRSLNWRISASGGASDFIAGNLQLSVAGGLSFEYSADGGNAALFAWATGFTL